jgi:hypothetical protein
MPIFTFPDDAEWDEVLRAVTFSVEIGEYKGVVRVPRAVFLRLLPMSPTPERCVEAFHLERARFEQAAERCIRERRLGADGQVELTTADLKP